MSASAGQRLAPVRPHEEVDRGQRAEVVVEERAPILRRWFAWPRRHEAGHASLADVNAELEQFAVDFGCAPERIGFGYLADELPDFCRDAALDWATRARLPLPEQAEPGPVPADHGVWLDNDKHVRPARPEARQNEPEGTVALAQARAAGCALEVGQLLAQGEVLDCEVRAGAEGGTQRSNEAEEQGTHRVIMHDGEAWRLDSLSIIATVGRHTSRTTSWRTTPSGFLICTESLRLTGEPLHALVHSCRTFSETAMADNIDLTNFSEEQLIRLNRRIVERLRSLHQGRCYKDLAQFKLGDAVCFTPERGHVVVGTVVRLNQKTATVAARDGHQWRVSPSFLSRITDQMQDDKQEIAEVVSLHSGGSARKLPP